jgi:hypothetical protein
VDFLDGNITTSITYGRYWHGYLALYRPLFIFFDLEIIRNLQFVVYLVLLGMLTYLINKRFGKIPAVIYATSLLGTRFT